MLTTTAFAARRAPVCGLDCAFTIAEAVGASVSSLYTFPFRGLARRWHRARNTWHWKRSPTLRRYHAMISRGATRCVECATELRGRQRRFCSRNCKNRSSYGDHRSQKARGVHRKQHLVSALGGRCSACGYNRCSAALSFHHKNPAEKDFPLDIRNLTNRKWHVILAEAKKCTLLCLNCHAEVHHA